MEKRLIQLLLLGVALFVVWSWWNPFWRYDLNEAVSLGNTEKIVFEIEKGSSAETIADHLEDADLIISESSFLRTVKKEELDGKLRYGRFVLSPSMTLREVITILTTEGTGELAVTIIEGWTVKDIDTELAEMGLIETGDFITCAGVCNFEYDFLQKGQSLEGYLFPDTYFIDSANFSVEALIKIMLSNFDKKWTDAMQAELEASGRSLNQVVTVASMLEKEVRTPEDLVVVSGIIWKRLDKGWYLGIDATLLYVQNDQVITEEDLAMESPYNTRLTIGLPPTPIGNPGLATLEAALNPEESEYYYYLTDEEGNVHYAKDGAEHETNKEKYLD